MNERMAERARITALVSAVVTALGSRAVHAAVVYAGFAGRCVSVRDFILAFRRAILQLRDSIVTDAGPSSTPTHADELSALLRVGAPFMGTDVAAVLDRDANRAEDAMRRNKIEVVDRRETTPGAWTPAPDSCGSDTVRDMNAVDKQWKEWDPDARSPLGVLKQSAELAHA